MAKISKRIVGPTNISSGATTMYTSPAGKRTRIKWINVVNYTGGTVGFSMSVGTLASATSIFAAQAVPIGTAFQRWVSITLEPAELIQMSGNGTSMAVTIDADVTDI